MPPGYGYAPYDTGGNFDLAYFGLRSDDPSVVDPRTGFTTFPAILPSGESRADFLVRTYNEGGNPYYGAVGANNNLLSFLQQSTDPRIQTIQNTVEELLHFNVMHHSLILYASCTKKNCENRKP